MLSLSRTPSPPSSPPSSSSSRYPPSPSRPRADSDVDVDHLRPMSSSPYAGVPKSLRGMGSSPRRLMAHRHAPIYLAIVLLITLTLAIGHQSPPGEAVKANLKSIFGHGGSGPGKTYHPGGGYEPANVEDTLSAVPDPMSITHVEGNYKWYTDAKLRWLMGCIARGDCHENAGKVVIFNNWYCYRALFEGYWGGEGTWCRGMEESLARQGYTTLYINHDWDYAMHIYRQIPDLVVAVVADDQKENSPVKPHLRTAGNPDGLPAWKHFRFNYYAADGGTRVGDRWVITCEPEWRLPEANNWRNFSYIGYAMEDIKHTHHIPFNERPYRAYVLGKHQTFFYEKSGSHVAWHLDMYKRVLDEMRKTYPSFEFVGAFFDERGDDRKETEGPIPLPEGIRNIYPLNRTQFDTALTEARMLVGIGWPTASPSPYRAFARGVPFISPFKVRDDGIPEDPARWSDSQHDSLRYEMPPLVYNVQEFDEDGFLAALQKGMETFVEPFIYERMTKAAHDERIRVWMETDWRTEAKRILELRKAGIETQGDWGEMFEL